jgi:hypothetical protein
LVVDDIVNMDVLEAVLSEFAALDVDQQAARANELSGRFERDLYSLSGLTEALGGADAVDRSITETADWYGILGGQVTIPDSNSPVGFRRPAAATSNPTSVGEGLFGGLLVTMLGADAAVSATNDGAEGSKDLGQDNPTRKPDPNDAKINITAKNGVVELTSEGKFTDKEGVTTTLKTRNLMAPCPTPDGTFEATATIDTTSTVNGGATGKRGTFDVTVRGTVDDDAHLVGYDSGFRAQYADFVDRRGGFIDISASYPQSGGSTFTVNRTGGAVTDEIVRSAVIVGAVVAAMVGDRIVKASQSGWESGRCVVLAPTTSAGPGGLEPSAVVTITAGPRSKLDGTPTGGSVTALLTGGEAAVSPSSTPLPADAEFTYDAPAERDKTGTVSLEARSRRGVGKATIDFDTKALYSYQIVGGADDFQTNTAVCNVLEPFTLSGGGFSVSFSGGLTGTYNYSGVFSASGNGEYAITLPDGPGKPGTMIGGGPGVIAGKAGSGTESYTLTPITC